MIKNSEHKAENMQKIYRRTPMSKLQSNFIDITLRHGYSGVDLLHILRTPFPKNLSLESSFYPQFLHADWSHSTFILCFYILYIKWQPSQHLLHGVLYPKFWCLNCGLSTCFKLRKCRLGRHWWNYFRKIVSK